MQCRIQTKKENLRDILLAEWVDAPIDIVEYVTEHITFERIQSFYRKTDAVSDGWNGIMVLSGDARFLGSFQQRADCVGAAGILHLRARNFDHVVAEAHPGKKAVRFHGIMEGPTGILTGDNVICVGSDQALTYMEILVNGPVEFLMRTYARDRNFRFRYCDGSVTLMETIEVCHIRRARDERDRDDAYSWSARMAKMEHRLGQLEQLYTDRELRFFCSTSHGRRELICASSVDFSVIEPDAFEEFGFDRVSDNLMIIVVRGTTHELWIH